MTQRQTLDIDLDTLFPGEIITIGEKVLVIRPLGFEQIAILTKKATGIGEILVKQGITWENYSTPASLFKLAVIVLENFPDILEEASNISIDSLKKFPLELIVEIIEKIIDANLKSKDTLEKNLKSLAKKFLPQTDEKENPESPKTPLQKIPEKGKKDK